MAQLFKAENGLYWNMVQLNKLKQGDVVVSGTGVKASQAILGVQSVTLTLTNAPVALVDATTNGASGSLKVLTLPAGAVTLLGGTTNLTIARVGTNLQATAAVVGAVGTAAAGADATLTGTEANIVGSTVSTLTAGAGVTKGLPAVPSVVDGTQTAAAIYLNFAVPDAGSAGNDTLTVNGTITFQYVLNGDN